MDKSDEQETAHEIEAAVPGAHVSVEDVTLPDGIPAQVAVIEGAEAERPHDEADMGYRLGRLETRLVRLQEMLDLEQRKLAAFAEATVAAVEAEQAELEVQGEVLSEVAEEVLPPEDDAAKEHNPGHGDRKLKWHEHFLGGRGRKVS